MTRRLHVVSDVHGQTQALSSAADGSDLFICLGDLILFLDYDDPRRGIHAELFGEQHTAKYIELRTAGRYEDARALGAQAWAGIGIVDPQDRWTVMESLITRQYQEMFAAMPAPALLTFGNVDVPNLWPQFLRPGHRVLDGETLDEQGTRIGFVGGGLKSPMRTPFERSEEEFAEKVAALGPVDVLCTHIPPAIPELTYDTVARRFEVGSTALVEYIKAEQPTYALFGHVHQPLAGRFRIGRTECINVGHFNATKRPFVVSI